MMKLTENNIVSLWIVHAAGEVFHWRTNRIEVIYPGRPSNNGGCDLNDAVFIYDGKTVTGDVEIHIKASDWNSHRHNNDSRYNNVDLHVVALDDTGSITRTQNGKYIPLLNIEELVRRFYGISIPSNGYMPANKFKCPVAANKNLQSFRIESLHSIGIRRLNVKAADCYKLLATEHLDQILHRSVARCLGYEKNAIPFENLAQLLHISILRDIARKSLLSLVSIIMGTAGLLPSQINGNSFLTSVLTDNQVNYIERFWHRSKFRKSIHKNEWHFFRIRPANHPVIRLLALSALIYRYRKSGIANSLIGMISTMCSTDAIKLEKFFMLDNIMPGANAVELAGAVIGRYKARDIVINAALPFLYAYGAFQKDMKLSDRAMEIFCSFPGLQDNYLLKYMRQNLMLESHHPLTAAEQQGLLHIFKQYCRYKDCRNCLLLN